MCLYFDCSRHWWNEFRNAKHPGFLEVIARIENIMYAQKFEGAAVGAFNGNIIARDLGLKEQTDVTTGGNEINQITQVEIVHTNEDSRNSKP